MEKVLESAKTEEKHFRPVQALERGLVLLELLAEAGGSATISRLSQESGLNIATVYRLLQTMVKKGFVRQDSFMGTYRLGTRMFSIGEVALKTFDIRTIARPYLEQLVEKCNETANLAILDGGEVVYIDQCESHNMIKMFARIGSRGPAHCTGAGKALLAWLPAGEAKTIIDSLVPLTRYTERTITDPDRLLAELAEIRNRGYSMDLEEIEEGVRCTAAPIFNHRGKAVAVVSVSGPSSRLTMDYLRATLIGLVQETAREISRELGHQTEGQGPVW